MAKQRFREIKKGQTAHKSSKDKQKEQKQDYSRYASSGQKIKAFLTDSFMLVMPIMYAVFYLVMGGREGFAAHKAMGWLYILVPLVIVQTIFMWKSGQTPGYRAYELTVVDKRTGEKPSFGIALFRNMAAVLSLFSFFGWLMMFFRKDHKTLHDLLSGTETIKKHASN